MYCTVPFADSLPLQEVYNHHAIGLKQIVHSLLKTTGNLEVLYHIRITLDHRSASWQCHYNQHIIDSPEIILALF